MVARQAVILAILSMALFSALLWSRASVLEARRDELQRANREIADLRDDIRAYNKAAKVRAMEFVRGKKLVEVMY